MVGDNVRRKVLLDEKLTLFTLAPPLVDTDATILTDFPGVSVYVEGSSVTEHEAGADEVGTGVGTLVGVRVGLGVDVGVLVGMEVGRTVPPVVTTSCGE